jgi:Tfp pilus assembly protein PilN
MTKRDNKSSLPPIKRSFLIAGALLGVVLLVAAGGWLFYENQSKQPQEAPEADKVLELQAHMPF